jgi:histidinol-phosphate/aromatic aminotransferase/cobyric acid decarboxylase-like protein
VVEPRDELRRLPPALHGGAAPTGVLDFSTGVSPLPAPAAILEAARAADLSRYPHPTAAPLRARLSSRPDEIVVGAGSVELIWALARAFAGPGRRALVLAPAFGEYAQAIAASGAELLEVRADSPPWIVAPDRARAALAAAPSLVFLCRPSNPCLSSMPADAVQLLAREFPRTLFVVDEAYAPMFDEVPPIAPGGNVAVLRSLTKVFALPGLRLGYLVADAPVARAVQATLPPWNVSAPAQAAGLAAVSALSRVGEIRSELARLRHRLAARLDHPRAQLHAAGGPFLVYDVGDAAAVCARLDALGVRVRDCASFGLPRHVRIGVRLEADQDVLARAWPQAFTS